MVLARCCCRSRLAAAGVPTPRAHPRTFAPLRARCQVHVLSCSSRWARTRGVRMQSVKTTKSAAIDDDAATSAAASAVAATRQRVCCRTVIDIAKPEDVQLVLMGNDLVSETFYNPGPNSLTDAVSFNSYRLRAAAQTLSRHASRPRSHATILAFAAASAEDADQGDGADVDNAGKDVPQLQGQQQLGAVAPLGVVNVTVMQASETVSSATGLPPGAPFAMLTNMAVAPHARRRGVGTALMTAALRTVAVRLDGNPGLVILLAYKHFEPAMRLYGAFGFSPTPWQDPLWLEDVQRGRLDRQRRVMLARSL